MDKIEEILTRGVEKVYPSKEALEKVLRSGKKLKLYQGFDPTMPSLTVGNLVGLLKLRQFQGLGHEVIFLIGDFTGMIGDPTDKLATRKMLTMEEVTENSKTWKQQSSNFLRYDGENPAKMLRNSDWDNKLNFGDLINITANFTVQQMIERDMFQKRLQGGKPIHLHEFLYPIAQAYDSVFMDVDLEVGGNDQTFNMLCGRTLMNAVKGKEKFVLTTRLLVDKNGVKVGKTAGNALFMDASPADLYGGIMTFPDEVLPLSFELLTTIPTEKVEEVGKRLKSGENPMVLKKELAFTIVSELHSQGAAQKAQEQFESTFQKGELGKIEIPEIKLPSIATSLATVFAEQGIVKSKSEAKQLIEQGAIEHDSQQVTEDETVRPGIYRIGKKRFIKFV